MNTQALAFFHKTNTPECQRMNRWLKSLDAGAFAVYNEALKVYEVWCRAVTGHTSLVMRLETDQGQPIRPEEAEVLVLGVLRAMLRPVDEQMEEILAHNARVQQAKRQEFLDRIEADAEYVAPAVIQELSGMAPRWSSADIFDSLTRAHGPA